MFVTRSGKQLRRRGKKTLEGVAIGTRLHKHVPSKTLQDARGGARKVALRGRCVSCYARAPMSLQTSSKRKTHMRNGDPIPRTSYACNVCRVLLCKTCHDNVYDHRCGGTPHHTLIVRWLLCDFSMYILDIYSSTCTYLCIYHLCIQLVRDS